MTKEDIIRLTTSYVAQALEGEVENLKCDFKAKWYHLDKESEIFEFLKDTSAIANTYGLDGIIIVGLDLRARTFIDSKFSDCRLKDTSAVIDLINSKVDRLYAVNIYDVDIDGHKLSIIHIPPSIDKPHVIRLYKTYKNGVIFSQEENRIFVRRGTSSVRANKYEIELMYYDRKNLIPDYHLITSIDHSSLSLECRQLTQLTNPIEGKVNFVIENLGRRPVAIKDFHLRLNIYPDSSDHERIDLLPERMGAYGFQMLILNPGNILNARLALTSPSFSGYNQNGKKSKIQDFLKNSRHLIPNLSFVLSTGEAVQPDVIWR